MAKPTTTYSIASSITSGYLLLENSSYLLQENGDYLIIGAASDILKPTTTYTDI